MWQDLDGCSNSNISPRLTSSRNSRCPTYKPFARTRLHPFDMKSLVFFLYFLILQASGQSPVVVTTTSGELHGSELDGGKFSTYVPRKFGCSDSHIMSFKGVVSSPPSQNLHVSNRLALWTSSCWRPSMAATGPIRLCECPKQYRLGSCALASNNFRSPPVNLLNFCSITRPPRLKTKIAFSCTL